MKKHLLLLVLAALSLTQLAGCGDETEAVTATERAVKIERIEAAETSRVETLAATVRAKQRSELGFESGGRVATLTVDVGDVVRAGQILATVDPEPAQERLRKADADRATAAASFAERDAQLRRVGQLQQDAVVAEAVLEDARLQRDGAAAQLKAAEAGLALARRELTMSRMVAPYDGRIVKRAAQPSMNVAAGQTVLEIEGDGGREAVAYVSAELAKGLKVGDQASIRETESGSPAIARLDKLSGHAENGSLIQAIFRVDSGSASLRPGTALMLELPGKPATAITVPASALLPASQAGQAAVYVLDPAGKHVALRNIRIGTGLAHDGRLTVIEGLKSGESVVTAGPAFLTDGQAVTIFESQTQLSDARP